MGFHPFYKKGMRIITMSYLLVYFEHHVKFYQWPHIKFNNISNKIKSIKNNEGKGKSFGDQITKNWKVHNAFAFYKVVLINFHLLLIRESILITYHRSESLLTELLQICYSLWLKNSPKIEDLWHKCFSLYTFTTYTW